METKTMKILFSAAALALLAGCSTPTVNLSTAEPIKVDIAMRLDVYDHNKSAGTKGEIFISVKLLKLCRAG